MPYIKELLGTEKVDKVVVVAPRADYNERKEMGWKASRLLASNVDFLINPTIDDVKELFENCKEYETYCFFSGINAFKEIVPWMKLSFSYSFHRGVITEPPLLYYHPLWQHKLRFALNDWRYVKYFERVLVMGDEFISYYQSWTKKWKVSPFIYCTEWKERTLSVPITKQLKVLYVGSLSERKNVEQMFAVLSQEVSLELGLVGDGEKRTIIEQMKKEAKAKVTFYGMQPMEKVPEIMQRYDVLILPSKHDGWGAVVNEALTLGLYVITSNHCGASYLLKDIQQGMIFDIKDKSSLVQTVNVCIAKRDWIRNTVNDRIAWSREYISGKAVAEYFIKQLLKT